MIPFTIVIGHVPQHSRQQISSEAREIIDQSPTCVKERAWSIEPPEVLQFREALSHIPDTTADFQWQPENQETLDVFSDGTGVDPRWPESRMVAWAWCVAVSYNIPKFVPVAEGGVPGPRIFLVTSTPCCRKNRRSLAWSAHNTDFD